jgi:quercetin dioxygenase-like cupin family protein
MKLFLQTLIALIVGCCLSATMFAQDPAKVAPKNYRVKLDNSKVRVLDVWLKPGDKIPMHSHPDSVIYVLNGGRGRFTDEHGKASMVTLKTGQCFWRNDETHAVQNVSKRAMHVLQIELKGLRIF